MPTSRSISKNSVAILGIRGIPSCHGGFETFAEQFSLYLGNKDWDVTVYCQKKAGISFQEDRWEGIRRVNISIPWEGASATVLFDLLSTCCAVIKRTPVLTLGYNTAVFCLMYRLVGLKNLINMDGIEWQRKKWPFPAKAWLWINEKLGAWFGHHLIADHPEIKRHLLKYVSPKKISFIPYSGALLSSADKKQLALFSLTQRGYALLIARPEPENSILEIVRAYSTRNRPIPLVILGNYSQGRGKYQEKVQKNAGKDIKFFGSIYDKSIVQALLFYARFYIHGHTVGGTNPSLVEALGAGLPVLAQNNKFNRWVAGEGALYFTTEKDCSQKITSLIENDNLVKQLGKKSIQAYSERFRKKKVLGAYERLLIQHGY